MTDILCRWLNEEVRLDPKLSKYLDTLPVSGQQIGFSGHGAMGLQGPSLVSPLKAVHAVMCIPHSYICFPLFSIFPANSSFAEQFSNGFLFGEVLHKHGLQVRLILTQVQGSVLAISFIFKLCPGADTRKSTGVQLGNGHAIIMYISTVCHT